MLNLCDLLQVLVLLVTGAILVFGSWGSKQMKVEFDPMDLTPKDSYMRLFKGQLNAHGIG